MCRDKEVLRSDNKSYGMIKFYHNREKVGHDINSRITKNGQGNCVAT